LLSILNSAIESAPTRQPAGIQEQSIYFIPDKNIFRFTIQRAIAQSPVILKNFKAGVTGYFVVTAVKGFEERK
jgi:hypothetical protein